VWITGAGNDEPNTARPGAQKGLGSHCPVTKGRICDQYPVADPPPQDDKVPKIPDPDRCDCGCHGEQIVKRELPITRRNKAAARSEPLQVKQRKAKARAHEFDIPCTKHAQRRLTLGDRIVQLIGQERSDSSRPAGQVPMLPHDAVVPQLKQAADMRPVSGVNLTGLTLLCGGKHQQNQAEAS
jgi:hypothetical protein